MGVKQIKSRNIPRKVVEQIKNNIMNHELKPGDRLPSERELAEIFDVSRTSIREALRSLEIIGIIKTVWGDGSYVSDDIEDSLSESIDVLFSLSGHNHEQVFQLRRAVEVETISLAAKKAVKEDVERLKCLFDKIENADNPMKSADFDNKFHNEIARISGNLFFTNLLKSVSNIMLSFILSARENIIFNKHMPIISQQHMRMITAIEKNDESSARKVMLQHLETIEKYYIKVLNLTKKS